MGSLTAAKLFGLEDTATLLDSLGLAGWLGERVQLLDAITVDGLEICVDVPCVPAETRTFGGMLRELI